MQNARSQAWRSAFRPRKEFRIKVPQKRNIRVYAPPLGAAVFIAFDAVLQTPSRTRAATPSDQLFAPWGECDIKPSAKARQKKFTRRRSERLDSAHSATNCRFLQNAIRYAFRPSVASDRNAIFNMPGKRKKRTRHQSEQASSLHSTTSCRSREERTHRRLKIRRPQAYHRRFRFF